MEQANFPPPGEVIKVDQLKILKAIKMAGFLRSGLYPYARYIECRREGENEVVVFKVQVEVGQITKNDIRDEETLAIAFGKADNAMPKVVALRKNFPSVPHINLGLTEFPRSLCLFDKPYPELKSRLTPSLLIERIREWLALTAKGQLHAKDQPLEPLLLGSSVPLILPHDLFLTEEESVALDVYRRDNPNGRTVLIAERIDSSQYKVEDIAITIKFPPQEHGQIKMNPSSLEQLQDFVGRDNLDLTETLSNHFRQWTSDQSKLNSRLIIIGYFPKYHSNLEAIKESDIWAFLAVQTIANIGEDLGLWKLLSLPNKHGQNVQTPGWLSPPEEAKTGSNTELLVLNPAFTLSRKRAANLNKITQKLDYRILVIGAGALGSQVITNCSRAGYGNWIIVDKDYLMPHNLARNALYMPSIGYSKAHGIMSYSRQVLGEEAISEAIMADVLEPEAKLEKLNEAYKEADIILDISASLSIPKHLVFNVKSKARRISAFLNPSGTDLVILAEAHNREQRLDGLEMQYYQELIENKQLHQHLIVDGEYHRYARSCSDLTNHIPNNYVSIHAATVSQILPRIIEREESFMGIWSINEHDMSTTSHNIAVSNTITPKISGCHDASGWTIITNRKLIDQLVSWRQKKLPDETGGVLVGVYDFERKIIYVAQSINSPPDSIERPTSYIRGTKNLPEKLEAYSNQTSGILEYIGEWHSHPDDFRPSPSDHDENLFEYIKEHMQINSQPTLMLIVGSNENMCWLVEG